MSSEVIALLEVGSGVLGGMVAFSILWLTLWPSHLRDRVNTLEELTKNLRDDLQAECVLSERLLSILKEVVQAISVSHKGLVDRIRRDNPDIDL